MGPNRKSLLRAGKTSYHRNGKQMKFPFFTHFARERNHVFAFKEELLAIKKTKKEERKEGDL